MAMRENFQRRKDRRLRAACGFGDRPTIRGAPQFGREQTAQRTSRLGAVAASLEARATRGGCGVAGSVPSLGVATALARYPRSRGASAQVAGGGLDALAVSHIWAGGGGVATARHLLCADALWTMHYALWTMHYALCTMDYGLWTMDLSLRQQMPNAAVELLGSCDGLSAPARCIGASLSRRFSRF